MPIWVKVPISIFANTTQANCELIIKKTLRDTELYSGDSSLNNIIRPGNRKYHIHFTLPPKPNVCKSWHLIVSLRD